MPIKTAAQRADLAAAYAAAAVEAALYTTIPDTTAGTEPGGVYARKPITWTASGDTVTASVTFDVPAGATIRGGGVHDDTGTYRDGGAVPEQPYAEQGTYTLNLSYTQQ